MGNTLLQPQPQPPLSQIPPPQPNQQQHQNNPTCEICIEPISNKFPSICSHPYCSECITKYIKVKLTDDNQPNIKCPSPNCDQTLDLFACAPLLSPALFVLWCDVKCEKSIMGFDKCYCPRRECGWLVVNECGGIPKKSVCPKCKGVFCFKCRMVWHSGFGCEESGELRDVTEVAFGRLVEQKKWMRCPKCRIFVELREGCQIVKCRCGVSFCYKCGKQVHQHWCSCDTRSAFMGWCCRIMLVLCLLTFAFFFIVFVVGKFQPKKNDN